MADRNDEPTTLRELTPRQWKTGVAAWLGWLFDGLDMHLYTLVAALFVGQLLGGLPPGDAAVKEKSSWIQAAFLVGWAVGGGVFGWLGDRVGRSRALSLTVLTYAAFTGLSAVAQSWQQLLVFRFLAALGIGGEWAIGAALLAETWPRRWRPWIAAVLQTGVNLGILAACVAVYVLAGLLKEDYDPRYVFLVGVLPAVLVWWIRRHVPEPEEWSSAVAGGGGARPGIGELFGAALRGTTLRVIGVCACSLTAWWAVLFWSPQHLRNLPELAGWESARREQLVSTAFFMTIFASVFGNFFAAFVARAVGYRRAIMLMCAGFMVSVSGAYGVPREWGSLIWWIPWIGFFSGVFALFTMYLPPLFPTLLRTTGAGFCFNIGRVAAAAGTVVFGLMSQVEGGDLRRALVAASLLFVPAIVVAWGLPEVRDGGPVSGTATGRSSSRR